MYQHTSLCTGSAPIFQSVFSSQILHPGAPLTLKCSASGDPMPEIRWFLYSRPLSDHHVEHHREGGSRLEPVDESLMMMSERRKRYRIGDFLDSKGVIISYVNVSSLTSHDGGLYSCQAFSESGSSTHSALIQVYGIPSIHPMDNVTIVTGAKLQVDCPFSGYPIQDIRWQKGNNFYSSIPFHFYSLLEQSSVFFLPPQMKMNESNESGEWISNEMKESASLRYLFCCKNFEEEEENFHFKWYLLFLLVSFLPHFLVTLIFAPFSFSYFSFSVADQRPIH